jgi:hypothetical protein
MMYVTIFKNFIFNAISCPSAQREALAEQSLIHFSIAFLSGRSGETRRVLTNWE